MIGILEQCRYLSWPKLSAQAIRFPLHGLGKCNLKATGQI